MNNPLEAVTQAVNSLVTALKLPDESAKANEVLGEMSFWTMQTAFCIWTSRGCFWSGVGPFRCLPWCGG